MKKRIIIFLLCLEMVLVGCTTSEYIDGKEYSAYGLACEDARKVPGITYEISAVNVILAIVFSETVIVPVYVVGWALYVPVRRTEAK